MTISNNPPRVQVTSNGTAGPYTFNFKIFEEEDLRVFDEGVQRTLTTDYTILFDFLDPDAESGTITFETAAIPTLGNTLTIDRRVSSERDTDFQQSGPPIQIPLNLEFDKLYAKVQEIDDAFLRLVRLSDTTEFTGDVIFPDGGATEINRVIGWNSIDGLTLENKDLAGLGAITVPVPFVSGGTGASYADVVALRAGLGLEIGVDIQAFSAQIPFRNVAQEWTQAQNFNATTISTTLLTENTTNGDFATDTDWTKGTGWTISGGVADVDGTQVADSDLEQILSPTLANGISYLVTFDVLNYTAGNLTPILGGTAGTTVSANGSYSEYILAGSTDEKIIFRADLNGDMQIDNVSVREVDLDWDLDDNQVATVVLDRPDITLDTPFNPKEGGTYILIVKQDGTGGRNLSFTNNYLWPEGAAPELPLAANAVSVLSFVYDGTNMLGQGITNFS